MLRVNYVQRLYYSTKTGSKNKLYSHTIFLPKTKFPVKLEYKKVIERDKAVTSVPEFNQLYKWQRGHLSEPEFVLHDGPPYANGKLHMGHAINKILKDTILRYHIIRGNKVHYVPGWDCHGLPIELRVLKSTETNPLEIRAKARNFAKNAIEEQKKEFQSWGVIGDWNHHYATHSPSYVKTQLKLFYKLYKKNLIYRAFKPIYWSPSTKTALAEAELEYNENHKSPSLFVRFKVKHKPDSIYNTAYALIWTTTPWTLPSNQAICYNKSIEYCLALCSKDNKLYILAIDSIKNVSETLGCDFQIKEKLNAAVFSELTYFHPIFKDRILKFLNGSHATAAKGTGLVHIAPAHGHEDFLLAHKKGIDIENLVDDTACYNGEAGSELQGKFVLNEGTQKALELIKDDIVHLSEISHSYPYDWRTKKPVIIRASQQWFIDTDAVKSRAIELLENVEIIPKSNTEKYKQTLVSQIRKRPYWCISRQRNWGVPIPVFLNRINQEVILDEDLIRHFCDLIDNNGTDFWWKLPLQKLIPEEFRGGLNVDQIEKGHDILDIWFDSGISWANALEGDKVADMYLEGVDQFTGWFQSSLITSVALRDKAPYKSIYVHGFAVDENGIKMSKSQGNVVDPQDIIKQKPYGIDTLRWWVACHANQDSVAHISNNVLKSSADELEKIRRVLKFAIGSLEDFTFSPINYEQLSFLDKYMLHLLYEFFNQSQNDIKTYQFNKLCISVINLLTSPVSALYYTGVKDRLYCNPINSISRKSTQFVLWQIFDIVTQVIAPIVPHMVEEMYTYLPHKTGRTYFTSSHSQPEEKWTNVNINKIMNIVISIKKYVNKEVGANTSNLFVNINFSMSVWKLIQEISETDDFKNELKDILQVSEVVIKKSDVKDDFEVEISQSNKFSCPRCRLVKSENEDELCLRCKDVVREFERKTVAIN